MAKDKRVKTLKELKEYCADESQDLYILLRFGLRSSKNIQYNTELQSWSIYNCIDDTVSEYANDKELAEHYPLFMEAIELGCLIKD